MDKITTEQLEEILERVEEGTTTQTDADVLRWVLFDDDKPDWNKEVLLKSWGYSDTLPKSTYN